MTNGKSSAGEVGDDLAAAVQAAPEVWHWHRSAGKIDPIAAAGQDELVAFLNQLLETERAGARAAREIARGSTDPAIVQLMWRIREDEMRWCAMLLRWVRDLDGTASPYIDVFDEKAVTVDDAAARIALFNRGQGWVVRKLRGMIPRVREPTLYADLSHMLATHVANITLANSATLQGKS